MSTLDRDWVLSPREPREFFARADHYANQLGGERFFNTPGLSWLREAWSIGRLAWALHANRARLSDTDPPDGCIELASGWTPVEVTEALEPKRRRGLEYRSLSEELRPIDQDRLEALELNFDKWVVSAAHKKIARQDALPEGTIILIHLSAWLFFIEKAEIWKRLFASLPKPSGNISAFAVLHGSECYLPLRLSERKCISLENTADD